MIGKEEEFLLAQKLINDEQFKNIKELTGKFSVFSEVRFILYAGLLMLSSGLGVLVYKNIDTLGHQVILAFIGLLCLACFYFAWKRLKPYSPFQVENESTVQDYILLLGCLLFLIFETYLQYQYNIFGTRYGLATVMPAVLFIGIAYRSDHVGILSLGITATAAWIGVTVNPYQYIVTGDFKTESLTWTALIFGVALISAGLFLDTKNIKAHFTFTYMSFALHLVFISLLTGMFSFQPFIVFTILLCMAFIVFYNYSKRTIHFYFLFFCFLYGHIGLTYVIYKFLYNLLGSDGIIFMFYFYMPASVFGIIWFFKNYKSILKLK